eukprot:CAMPEP_0205908176 /NCGR_PEP_ID=MMETSP1325-20131115/3034_1 /ASSEMBLY_ACC=CAM_ASM_000708 /TAXON_ID=236786 /ORGANISM="Florenciella sp., Strain RCC1007" /LENGTH=433 /DNA_ID=CAMNT_0053274345 /DNA_START=49 /DNA_END=1350 /DNA_ORIENTATION=-
MSMTLSRDGSNELLYLGFNQDHGCFACGMDNGFRIYNCEPFKETFRRAMKGGIGIVEMLFRCNLLALVGGGRNPKFPPNIVKIWDDHQNRAIGELMFRSEVKAVKLRRDRVVVVLLHKIYVYRFSDLKLLDQISTLKNPKGLIALCPDASNVVLACPGVTKGNVRVELYDMRKSSIIPAHESELAQIALNLDGTRLATASDKGTLIRVFDTHTGDILKELRRGMDRAVIHCVTFNKTSDFLACSSDKGTVHIFALGDKNAQASQGTLPQNSAGADAAAQQGSAAEGGEDGAAATNNKSNFAFVRRLLPGIPKYVESEWSFAQVRGLESTTICAFGQDPRTLIVVSADGSYLLSSFAEPGECERVSYARFIRSAEEEEADDMGFQRQPDAGTPGAAPAAPAENTAPPAAQVAATAPPAPPATDEEATAGAQAAN